MTESFVSLYEEMVDAFCEVTPCEKCPAKDLCAIWYDLYELFKHLKIKDLEKLWR